MADKMGQLTIGLSMIVKDESHVILRVLNSIYKYIDYWAIVDTGSTDGTQDIIKNFFAEKNIPGELIQSEWVDNFSTSRNMTLEAVEKVTEYGIWIDADEEFITMPGFSMKMTLTSGLDTISIPTKYGGVEYTRKSIWKCGRGFRWSGPIHEILASPTEGPGGILNGAHVFVRAEGNSWKDVKAKYTSHAQILEKYVETDKDARWVFYTAQSWRDAGEHQKSFDWYEKRSKMNEGFQEEIFFSKFMMAKLAEPMNKERPIVVSLYTDAHRTDPVRGESIKSLVQYLQRLGDWETSYVYSKYGLRYNLKNPYPERILFIDNRLYQFEMMELHSVSCFQTGRMEEASVAFWQFKKQLLPDSLNPQQVEVMNKNEQFFLPYEKVKHYFDKGGIQALDSGIVPAAQHNNQPGFHQNNPNQRRGSNYTPPKKKRKK